MRILSLCVIFLLYATSAQAENIDYLTVGEGVYIEGFASDELVYITHIDKANNRVRVRRADDNVAEWVHASRLITADRSRRNNVERGVVAVGLVAEGLSLLGESTRERPSINHPDCSFDNPDACGFSADDDRYRNVFSDPDPDPPVSESPGRLTAHNNCEQSIKLAIRYLDTSGEWVTRAWYEIPGNGPSDLLTSSGTVATTEADFYYLYALSEDGTYEWDGDHNFPVTGRTIGMLRIDDDSGDREFSLTCIDE